MDRLFNVFVVTLVIHVQVINITQSLKFGKTSPERFMYKGLRTCCNIHVIIFVVAYIDREN